MQDGENFPGEFAHWPEENWVDMSVQEGVGTAKLATYRHQVTANVPRALWMMIHGFNGYSGSYAHVAQNFVQNGIESIAYDHRCNGKSTGNRGNFDNVDILLDDLTQYYFTATQQYPNVPVFIMGQSLGGLLALRLSLQFTSAISGLILLAPLVRIPIAAKFPRIRPSLGNISRILGKAPFPTGKKNTGNRLKAVWEYKQSNENYYTGKTELRTINALVQSSEMLYRHIGMIQAPMMIHRAGVEKVVDNSATQDLYDKSRSEDKVMYDYPEAWHDLSRDPDIYQIIDRSAKWIKDRI